MCGEDMAWERGQRWTSVRPGRTTSLPRCLAQTHDIGCRGNIDSVGHLCVRDAQLPCQDFQLKSMSQDTLWCTWTMLIPPRRLPSVCPWRGNTDSVRHVCIRDAQLPCQDAWLKSMT